MEKEFYTFRVEPGDKGKRLDKLIVERFLKKFSRSFIQKLMEDGNVLLSGQAPKRHHIVNPGEVIEVTVPAPIQPSTKGEDIPLDIVYEDDHLLVVNKSQEMVVHPAPGNYTGTLVNALLSYCKNLSGIGGEMKPGIVHRIDKGTSGLLIVAKNDEAHRNLARQFKDKTIRRVYVALVKGVVDLDNGTIELPISRSYRDRKKMAVNFESEKSKNAITHYKVVKRFKDFTLLELVLGTGRTHQIRVHLSYIGHPIVGDVKYGNASALLGRPALHAKTIGFVHPVTKKYMEFTNELPDDMKNVISHGHL